MREIDVQSFQESTRSQPAGCHRGLNEALWSCVLNDYVDDEDAREFDRIVGKDEMVHPSAGCMAFPRTSKSRIDPMFDPRASDIRVGLVSAKSKSRRKKKKSHPPPAMLLALQNQEVESIPQISQKWNDRLKKFEEQQAHKLKQKEERNEGSIRSVSVRSQSSVSTASRAKSKKAPSPLNLASKFRSASRSRSFVVPETREEEGIKIDERKQQPRDSSAPRDLPPRSTSRSSRLVTTSRDWVDQVPMERRSRSTKSSSAQSTQKSTRSFRSRSSSIASFGDRSRRSRTPRRMFSRGTR